MSIIKASGKEEKGKQIYTQIDSIVMYEKEIQSGESSIKESLEVQIHITICLPILIAYYAESWSMIKNTESRIIVIEMNMKRVLDKTKMGKEIKKEKDLSQSQYCVYK